MITQRLAFTAIALLVGCASQSPAPAPSPAPPDQPVGAGSGSDMNGSGTGAGSGSGSGIPTDPGLTSSATAAIDGTDRAPTHLVAHLMPFENHIGIHVRLASLDGTSYDDILAWLPPSASGDVDCGTGTVIYMPAANPSGYQSYSDPGCGFTNISIGPIGGYVSGMFTGTVLDRGGTGATTTVEMEFQIVRDGDSEWL